MSKVKDWLYDVVEEKINILKKAYKDEIVTKDEAINHIMQIQNIDVWVGDEVDYSIASEILFLCLEKYSGVDLSAASKQEREEKLQKLETDTNLIERINTINDRILLVKYSGSASAPFEEDLKIVHSIIDDLL